ncbi:peptidase inhibitor family I36 protein [Streptomyces humi]
MPVTVYADVDYKGKSATLDQGRHNLDPSMNDCISSVRVPSGWKATLYEHPDFTGAQLTLDADTRNVDGALHDKASSIIVAETDEDEGQFVYSADNGDNWFYFEDNPSGA